MNRGLKLLAVALFLLSTNAPALQMVKKAGIYVYFPSQEAELVARFTEPLPDMLAFLSEKGLPVQPPLHVILDDRLDAPEVKDRVIPHKEVRIPIRAPGVLEDGFTESDPWAYFLFKGLCLQGIYGLRSGIPGVLHKGFGEIISPNRVLPPWVDDGICSLLYSLYREKPLQDPVSASIFALAPVPDLDVISHHPQVWPGYYAHRIYGRPFVQSLYREYGWSKIIEFLRLHGRGIVPYEIDLKAGRVFGKSIAALWRDFQTRHPRRSGPDTGLLISGYWTSPPVFWNNAGVFPGRLRIGQRGRYGYVDASGTLWISEFDGNSRIYRHGGKSDSAMELYPLWDPGPGRVAVGRQGHKSWIIIFPDDGYGGLRRARQAYTDAVEKIPAPDGVIQLSGPVRNERGQIAVAANTNGNWNIWMHDGQWHQLTESPSIELDPWWEGDTLVWASNSSGRFQIHQADNTPITKSSHAAMLPRNGKYLELTANGWQISGYEFALPPVPEQRDVSEEVGAEVKTPPAIAPEAYDPFKSLWPNYVKPDIFAGISDFQLGLETGGRDVSGDYEFDAGIRYSFDNDFVALQALLQRKTVGTRYARYPFGFDNAQGVSVTEDRNDVALFWRPLDARTEEHQEILKATTGADLAIDEIDLSINYRRFEAENGGAPADDEAWIGFAVGKSIGSLRTWGNVEIFSENRQFLSGGISFSFGKRLVTTFKLRGGKSWGEPIVGRDTFRLGGDVIEGGFTRRPTRLFPVRGFDSSVIEGSSAIAASTEVAWPLANLQFGYQALPLFLHRMQLGAFLDAGLANKEGESDDALVGGGFELVTSLEAGWGGVSTFHIGVAWPLEHPSNVDQGGPVIVFQLGLPL